MDAAVHASGKDRGSDHARTDDRDSYAGRSASTRIDLEIATTDAVFRRGAKWNPVRNRS